MIDPFSTIILTVMVLAIAKVAWNVYRDGKYVTIFATQDELERKLDIVRKYKGFSDEFGLDNEEVVIKATYLDPYGENRQLSYLIYVPKIVLTNARYEDSKKRFEQIFEEDENDG